jgi:hypothetical protein
MFLMRAVNFLPNVFFVMSLIRNPVIALHSLSQLSEHRAAAPLLYVLEPLIYFPFHLVLVLTVAVTSLLLAAGDVVATAAVPVCEVLDAAPSAVPALASAAVTAAAAIVPAVSASAAALLAVSVPLVEALSAAAAAVATSATRGTIVADAGAALAAVPAAAAAAPAALSHVFSVLSAAIVSFAIVAGVAAESLGRSATAAAGAAVSVTAAASVRLLTVPAAAALLLLAANLLVQYVAEVHELARRRQVACAATALVAADEQVRPR